MNEHITSVEATYDNPKFFRNTVITSLKFETSKGSTAVFGYEVGKKFVLGQNGGRLLGFHGKEGEAIDALGAYFEQIPVPAPTPVIGDPWGDYGIYDGVKKITIGLYEEGIAFLKFVYIKGNGLVTGDDHGKITSLGAEEVIFSKTTRVFFLLLQIYFPPYYLHLLSLFIPLSLCRLCLRMVNISQA